MLAAAVCCRFRQQGDATATTEGWNQGDGSGFNFRFYEAFQCSILIMTVSCFSASVCGGGLHYSPINLVRNTCQLAGDGWLKCILEEVIYLNIFELWLWVNRATPSRRSEPPSVILFHHRVKMGNKFHPWNTVMRNDVFRELRCRFCQGASIISQTSFHITHWKMFGVCLRKLVLSAWPLGPAGCIRRSQCSAPL